MEKKARSEGSKEVKCRLCSFGACCAEGVEADLFEVARILQQPLDIPKPWFDYLGRDKRAPSGYKFSTIVRKGRCVFQNDEFRCLIYPVRPRYCVEFPLEDGKKAPYYHHLCYHGKKSRRAPRGKRS
jgi:Fe-S-cluster containining protein